MDLDPLSIVSPARVKVLLIPVGHVRQSRFASFVGRLQYVNVVRLGDVSPDSRPHRTMFSPLAFPEGLILYDMSTTAPPPSYSALSTFERYRETLVVIGIVDGRTIEAGKGQDVSSEEPAQIESKGERKVLRQDALESLSRELDQMSRAFPKALVHQLLIFDNDSLKLPSGVYSVPSPARSRTTTVKTVMCDLTSKLLAEMTTYAKSIQSLPSLDSPKISPGYASPSGTISALPTHMAGLPRPGSAAETPRSSSSAEDRPEPSHRMSIPAILPSSMVVRSSTTENSSTSPPSGAGTPPTSLNGIGGTSVVHSPPKMSGHDRSRTTSRDRVSVNGFGSGNLGERERIKGKGRVGVVIGAMYLLAGRWPDAMKELVNSATIARGSSDYVWHAKAMDYILVCLLMYAWAGMDFRIPEILFPSTEKPSSSSKSSINAPSSSLPEFTTKKSLDPESRAVTLRSLTSLLPDLTNNILNLYARAWTFTDDKLPTLAFSQSAVRFAKLLSAIHLSQGVLDDSLLAHLVLSATISPSGNPPPETPPFLTKTEIANFLFRAYPQPLLESALSISDHTAILAAIISVLSELGYRRKKALILKELISGLVPALVQARKDGAAEMGVHPAASLAALNAPMRIVSTGSAGTARDDSEEGAKHLLSLVCQAYGIKSLGSTASSYRHSSPAIQEEADVPPSLTPAHASEIVVVRALKQASSRACGFQDLKLDILRTCINLCEALPDLGGALHYSADLLRLGGSGIAPGPDSSDGLPELPIDEQVRLANNISRTLSAARQLGLAHPEAEYWDDFLVRNIETIESRHSTRLLLHAKSELEMAQTIEAKKEGNPFIYNPFLKVKALDATGPLLIAQEETFFRVTLQNLFDFDVIIERIKLLSEGVPFDCSAQAISIGPYRTQTILLSGIPQAAGSVSIIGCTAKIRGCLERSFPMFREPWSLKADVKGRHTQLKDDSMQIAIISEPGKIKGTPSLKGPIVATLALNVISAQPNIIMKNITAPQSAIVLLEGETKIFSVTLQNCSSTTPVDLLLVSFDDSTTALRQSTLTNKGLSASELYELEHDSAHKQTLRWLRGMGIQDLYIGPDEETCLEIEVLGKPGLSYGTVQVDYCHLGIAKSDMKQSFYTRQLVINITITVNASIDLLHNDFTTLPSGLQSQQSARSDSDKGGNGYTQDSTTKNVPSIASVADDHFRSLFDRIRSTTSSTPYCFLLLDLRNSSPNTFLLNLELSSIPNAFTHTQSINAGITARILLPVPCIYLPNAFEPIPSLNPANKRQFVVPATKSSPEAERAMREAFWYREALLSRLNATWKDEETGRAGEVDLRGLQLTPHMLSVFKLPELSISLSVTSAETSATVKEVSPSNFQAPTATFLTLHTTLHNRSASSIRPLLRLQPTLADQPPSIALDLTKKLLVNGLLQRALPTLEAGATRVVETGFSILCSGVYEWGAIVEDVLATDGRTEAGAGRLRAATGEMDMKILGGVRRRIWNAAQVCTVVAREGFMERYEDQADEIS